jgi:hypothetical protein
MRRRIIALAVSLVFAAPVARAEAASETLSREEVLVAPAEFNEPAITRICFERLGRLRPQLLDVWFFRSDADSQIYRTGTLSAHPTYDTWRRAFERIRVATIPVAEMVSVGDSAVLLFRGPDQQVSRRVLRGADPTEIDLPEGAVHITHLGLMATRARSAEYRVQVFGWTDARLTAQFGAEVFTVLVRQLGSNRIDLSLRADPWFIDDPAYPVWPLVNVGPPMREEFITSPTLTCGRGQKDVRCELIKAHP